MADDKLRGAAQGVASGALAGAAFGLPGTIVGGLLGGAAGYLGTPKRPKYNILPENEQNKALAAQAAFGINPSIRQGISQVEQNAAEDVNTAQQYTANTGSILNVLKSINSNKNFTDQNLLGTSGQLQMQGRNQLMGANLNAIDEQDKAWNYNINQPYQNRVAANRELIKGTSENFWKLLDSLHARNLLTQDNTYTASGKSSSQFIGQGDFNAGEQGYV